MSWEITYVLAVAGIAVFLFIAGWIRMDQVAIGVPAVLLLGGVIDLEHAVAGLANEATITVAAMLVLGLALSKTGFVDVLGRAAARVRIGTPRVRLALLCLVVASVSPFLSNTAVVVVLLPVFVGVAESAGEPPSRYLIPLSYTAILGGTVTLIGTSSNLIVHNLAREKGFDELSMFSIAPLGLIYLAAGTLYMFTIGSRLLPHRPQGESIGDKASSRVFTSELTVTASSRLVGRQLDDLDLATRHGLDSVRPLYPWYHFLSDAELSVGDIIRVTGDADAIFGCAREEKLETPLASGRGVEGERAGQRTVELMVSPGSQFAGRSLRGLRFGSRYGAIVVAVQRPRRPFGGRLSRERLAAGDLLLVQGSPEALARLIDGSGFTAIGEVPAHDTWRPHALVAVGILAGVVFLATVGVMSIASAAFLGAVLAVFSHCVRIDEVYRELDWVVLALLAGLLPLGIALDETGAAAWIGAGLAQLIGDVDPRIAVGCFYLLTSILTEMMSNQATAVVLTPIAISTAATLGINPYALIVAVMFGASASFMTPMGYQTNAIIFGPGGYRFSDYVKVGAPLNLMLAVLAAIFIPYFWG